MSDTESPIYLHGNVFLEFLPHIQARVDAIVEAARAAERERAAKVFDRRDSGSGGFYEPGEPAKIIRALK